MRNNLGFTFIEVLLTITIIGILTALGTASFKGSQQQTRDTQRKNDLRQYQIGLENYSGSNNSLYPSRTDASGVSARNRLCPDINSTITFMTPPCPEDPKNKDNPNVNVYRYQSNGSGDGAANATQWVLWAGLERSENYWVVCSSSNSGEAPVANFGVSGGVCPI